LVLFLHKPTQDWGLITFSLIQIQTPRVIAQRENAAREFKTYLDKVRADSVKRRAVNTASMSSVSITANNSYTVSMDFNSNGVIETSEARTIPLAYSQAPQFVTTGITLPITIRYDWRGKASILDGTGATIAQNITLRDGGSSAMPTASNATTILISTYGDSSIATGGSVAQPLPTPHINVNANTPARPYTQVNH
jgi:hypothetical protein